MWAGIVTLFPEMFNALESGVIGRAKKCQLFTLACFNPRDYSTDRLKRVDDKPYGGGPGMLMKTEPLAAALAAAKEASPSTTTPVIYLSPQGRRFQQASAEKMAQLPAIIMLAGRYEGVDQRVIENYIDEEWSIGDYILTGGELPAMVMLETIIRLLPGVLGDQNSIQLDSITSGLLKHPQYTRPAHFKTAAVPAVLLSGNHQQVENWRLQASLAKTWLKRPDLLIARGLSTHESALLSDYLEHITVEEKK